MSTSIDDDLSLYTFEKTDDPVVLARRRRILERIFEVSPELREELEKPGVIRGARRALRNVLAVRGLALGAEDEAQIDACTDVDTLRRWARQSAVATSTAEALR